MNRILAHLRNRNAMRGAPLLPVSLAAIGASFGVVAAFGNVSESTGSTLPQRNVVESLSLVTAAQVDQEDGLFIREEKIRPGDSAASLLGRLGMDSAATVAAARTSPAAQPLFRQLSPGKTVTAYLNREGELRSLVFPLNDKQNQALTLEYSDQGVSVQNRDLVLEIRTVVKSADITHSLFGATDAAGIPDGIASQLVDIFGGDIDFHRDLRKGDHFSVAYESTTHMGKPLRSGRILAAEFINDGQSFKAIWFENATGQGGYYTPEGKNLRKAFLRSPLEFSRVTSGFSMSRFHPVLKKWRAHKGVDYGAPIGTRVKATGDATVDFAGNQNGYGKVVILRHRGGPYTTLYAHLSGFAPGIRKGSRVAQGDIIGYVGKTGLASGPHLHYEFRVRGVFKNPLAIVLPESPPLSKAELANFNNHALKWITRLSTVRHITLASSD